MQLHLCYYQFLKTSKTEAKTINTGDDFIFDNPNIIDELEPTEDENETNLNAMDKALKLIKDAGGKCYELLTLFWYKNKSMEDLTSHFGCEW